LDFLGFPWILSSESSLFNGLRGIEAGTIFLGALSSRERRRNGGPRSMMLLGFAIENLLKGLLISAKPNMPRPRKLTDAIVANHRLTDLVKSLPPDIRPKLTADETSLLGELYEMVVWRGVKIPYI